VTVKELREKLLDYDQDALVVLSSDPEGNSFNALGDVEGNSKYDHSSGRCGIAELTGPLEAAGYSNEDVMSTGKKAVVLWP